MARIGLFDIGQEFQTLYELANELEYTEDGMLVDNSEALLGLFDDMENILEEKLENTNYIVKELAIAEQSLKEEAKRLTEKAKAFANRQQRLKDLIKAALEASGQTKVKTEKFNFSIRTIDDFDYTDCNVDFIDTEYVKVKKELNKTEIKAAYKAGLLVEGLKVTEKTSLTVR